MDYKNSVIYKLCCRDVSITDCYVGSTTSFNKRESAHRSDCNNVKNKNYNINVYQFIRKHGQWQNWSAIIVENFPCESKNELHTRERYWLESLNATLNRVIPTRNRKEWCENNPEKIKEKDRRYRKKNIEKLTETWEKAKEKIPCTHCDKILSRGYMKAHIKRKHT